MTVLDDAGPCWARQNGRSQDRSFPSLDSGQWVSSGMGLWTIMSQGEKLWRMVGKDLSPLLFRREVGFILVHLFPLLQCIGSKSILRRAKIGQSALEHSHSPQLWVSILGMPVLSSVELGSVRFLGQEGLSWSFSESRQMIWEETIKTLWNQWSKWI